LYSFETIILRCKHVIRVRSLFI